MQNDRENGPVDTASLESLLRNRTLNSETIVQKEGTANWAPVRTFPELAAIASAGGPVSPVSSGASPPPPGQPPQIAPESDAADIEKNKIYAILAYISILFIVPLVAAPQSKFARYHANQGIVLFLATVIGTVGSSILAMTPIGCFVFPVPFALAIGAIALSVIGILNAANGQYKPLPGIGHFQLLK